MRIGIDARLTHYSVAGISTYIRHLIHELLALEPAVDWRILVSRRQANPGPQTVRLVTPCHHRLERWALGTELLLRRLDLLHSPDFIPPAWGSRRMVITVHDLSFLFYPQFLTPEALRYYADQIQWAIGRADHILADSHQTRQDLISELGAPPDRVTTVHLAANARFGCLSGPFPALERYGLSPGYILFVGTLEPRKNVPGLLRAYRTLLDRGATSAPLVLAGRLGWLAEETLHSIEIERLRNQVRILDDVLDLETLVQVYNGAKVLTLASYYEGFGLPVLEAMACGVPVIASDRGSLPEIVGQAGLLVNPDDPDSLADALERVMNDDELRARLIARGLERAASFTWQETARQTYQVYQQVLGQVH